MRYDQVLCADSVESTSHACGLRVPFLNMRMRSPIALGEAQLCSIQRRLANRLFTVTVCD